MNDFLTRLKEAEGFCSLGEVGSDEVSAVEKELNLSFADDYRKYVMAYGAATFEDHELTGISKSDRLSVLSTTKRARCVYPKFPTDMYVIEELLIDHMLITQNSTGAVFCYGPDDSYKQIAASLKEYLFQETNYNDVNTGEPMT